MQSYTHLLLDIEAAGPPGCDVIAIALVPIAGPEGLSPYTANIRLPAIIRAGAAELAWWASQPPDVQAQISTGNQGKNITQVAHEVLTFFREIRQQSSRIFLWSTAWEDFAWCNQILAAKGTSIREENIKTCDAGTLFRTTRLRTPQTFPGKHIALNDAIKEAEVTRQAGTILGIDWDTFGDPPAC